MADTKKMPAEPGAARAGEEDVRTRQAIIYFARAASASPKRAEGGCNERSCRARGTIDWPLASALAAETLPAWAPALLGRHVTSFKPGEVAWWPNCCDGVVMFAGPPPAYIGDWTGRWRRGDRWGRDVVELVAAARGCRPGQAAAWIARAAGVPLEALLAERRAA